MRRTWISNITHRRKRRTATLTLKRQMRFSPPWLLRSRSATASSSSDFRTTAASFFDRSSACSDRTVEHAQARNSRGAAGLFSSTPADSAESSAEAPLQGSTMEDAPAEEQVVEEICREREREIRLYAGKKFRERQEGGELGFRRLLHRLWCEGRLRWRRRGEGGRRLLRGQRIAQRGR